MTPQVSMDEQQWIEILKDVRSEQIATLKEDVQKLKEEAKRKKTPRLQDYVRLRKRRNIDLQEAQTRINTRFEQKEHELDSLQSVTNEYFSCVISRKPSVEPTKKFKRAMHENQECLTFYSQMLGIIKRKKDASRVGPELLRTDIKDALYLAERMSAFISSNKEKNKNRWQVELDASKQEVRQRYSDDVRMMRGQCREIRCLYKEERKNRLRKTAAILVESLIGVPTLEQKMSEFESKICRALFDAEVVQLSNPNAKFAATSAEFDADQDSEVRETLEQMVYNKIIDEPHAIRALCLINANYREEGLKEEVHQGEQTRQSHDPARRLEILSKIVEEESIARRILETNPALASVGVEKFETYISALKDTKRALHYAGRERRLNLHPEQFASLPGLRQVTATLDNVDDLERIYASLEQSGFDPEIIDAVVLAFKPGSKNFVGGNYIRRVAVRNNARPHLPKSRLNEVEGCLDSLVNAGVVLTHGKAGEGAYSLNSRIDEQSIPSRALRQLVQYRMPHAHGSNHG